MRRLTIIHFIRGFKLSGQYHNGGDGSGRGRSRKRSTEEIDAGRRGRHQKKHRWGKLFIIIGIFIVIYESIMIFKVLIDTDTQYRIKDKITEMQLNLGHGSGGLKDNTETEPVLSSEDVEVSETVTTEMATQESHGDVYVNESGAVAVDSPTVAIEAGAIGTDTSSDPVEIVFAGDIYLSDHVMEAFERAGNDLSGVVSADYQNVINEADYFVANEEFPFSTRGEQAKDKQYTFRVDPTYASWFNDLGIDLVTLANNHTLDYGTEALLDTVDTLDDIGIRHIGAGKNLESASQAVIVSLNNKKIAFIGATRVIPEANWAAGESSPGVFAAYNDTDLINEIKSVRAEADVVIVYMHWGVERQESPNEIQQTLAHNIVDAGADLVIGAHPHVLQGFEYYKDVPIAYSLGNFVFGSSIPKTALLKATISGDNDITLQLVPGTSGAGFTHTIDSKEAKSDFYSYITSISSGITVNSQGIIVKK